MQAWVYVRKRGERGKKGGTDNRVKQLKYILYPIVKIRLATILVHILFPAVSLILKATRYQFYSPPDFVLCYWLV